VHTQLCSPDKIDTVLILINDVINEDVNYSKSPLDLRNQRCYAVKVYDPPRCMLD
jgi:DNA mismatch repair protein MSH4